MRSPSTARIVGPGTCPLNAQASNSIPGAIVIVVSTGELELPNGSAVLLVDSLGTASWSLSPVLNVVRNSWGSKFESRYSPTAPNVPCSSSSWPESAPARVLPIPTAALPATPEPAEYRPSAD